MAALLHGVPFHLRHLADFPGVVLPPEGETSYADNALGKARAVAAATGELALADDSGIEVDALSGRPGVLSARYGGGGPPPPPPPPGVVGGRARGPPGRPAPRGCRPVAPV